MIFVPSDYAVRVLGIIDQAPRYDIKKEQLEEHQAAILVDCDITGGSYYVNTLLDDSANQFKPHDIVELSSESIRTRAQLENSDMELFPGLAPEAAGFARPFLEELFKKDYRLAEIDYHFFGIISLYLWRNQKIYALPLIKRIAPMDASKIIEVTQPFICDT